MCRLIAAPPGTTKHEALDILLSMEGRNTDGTGYAYVKDGNFCLSKSIKTASALSIRNPNFLAHMPYNGWTLIHIRAATHGAICTPNVHPFVVGNNCVAHNGVWSDHRLVRLALSKRCKFHGNTDSETAANLINEIGIRKFTEEIDFSGVFIVLKRTGDLFAIKTSGELAIHRRKNETCLLASELEFPKYKSIETINGYYHFDRHGKFSNHFRKPRFISQSAWSQNHYRDDEDIMRGFPNAHLLPKAYC